MAKRLQQSQSSANTNKISIRPTLSTGIVVDVILDDSHERITQLQSDSSVYTDKDTGVVGTAVIRTLKDNSTNESSLFLYKPLNSSLLEIPLIGETVELYKIENVRYYRRITSLDINVGNAAVDKNKLIFDKTDNSNNNKSYSNISQTGTSNSSTSNDRSTKLGEYFEQSQVNRLKLYEGDSILQSRFGQSIRFSGYNNDSNTFSPSIIIRNRQNSESLSKLKPGDLVEEDLNKDGSVISLTSSDYKIPFQPGLVDDGGSSNFKTTPIKFELPEEYTGQDQILINSERLILSSKSNEMIFFSKGNYGFISDGKFTIDNGIGGADLDFGDDVNITTDRNNRNFYVKTGNGKIWLNTKDNGESPGTNDIEPLVRGETLVTVLEKLIDLITAQIFATPAGPTAKGPLNIAQFQELKAQLDTIKSTLNFTE